MKAGIITYASAHNYGALLQAYAMQTYLEKKGIKVDIINYRLNAIDKVYKPYNIKKTKNIVLKIYRKTKKYVFVNLFKRWRIQKYNNFEHFINDTLNTTKPYTTLKELKNNCSSYDLLISGSDQVWNTDLTKTFCPAYFLEFGKKEAVRISYAPSLGREDIDPKFEQFYRRYLKNFDYISVREKSMIPVFQKLTDTNITEVLDPTLLLDKEDYEKLKEPTKYANEKFIYVHFIGKDERLVEIADKISRDLGIKILHNFHESLFDNELACRYNESPKKIIDVVQKAEMIVTNSFHLTVLSLIYEKKFITIPHSKRPERMLNLLNMVGLSDHLVTNVRLMDDINSYKENYKKVKSILEEKRQQSFDFLEKAINLEKPEKKSNYFTTNDKFDCYGCGLCASICPAKAITMEKDEEGFVYPKIDKDKCINCKLCERKCIYKNNKNLLKNTITPLVYGARIKDDNIRKNSASGGMFAALYKYVLSKNGYVVGVTYNENMEAEYSITNKEEICKKFMGSKYVAAKVGDIKEKVKERLENKDIVLFVGNPCQIVALKQYLGKKEYENLYLVEIICHGVCSPMVFDKYCKYLSNEYDSKINDFEFRNKKDGWNSANIKVKFKNGENYIELAKYNNYNRAFLNNYLLRPSCYNCEFPGKNQHSDLTIGDFWGIDKVKKEENDNKGLSVIKVNTEKGIKLFEAIKPQIHYFETNYKDGFKANHTFPCVYNLKRESLMKEAINTSNINKLLEKYNQYKNK